MRLLRQIARAGYFSHARTLVAMGAGGLALLSARPAEAQLGAANVPLPNVLLLVDTSGSFEQMIDGSNPEDPQNQTTWATNPPPFNATCTAGPSGGTALGTCTTPPCPTIPNRWGTLTQALTGTIEPFYSCFAMNRQATAPSGFTDQYAITVGGNTEMPYDYGYYQPFHRPLAYNAAAGKFCAFTPNALPGASGADGVGLALGTGNVGSAAANAGGLATDFPASAITQNYMSFPGSSPYPFAETTNNPASPCTFTQQADGAIDGASSLIRFGMMSFDNDPATGIGINGTTSLCASPPFDGQWSYFPNWTTGGTPMTGWPQGCTTTPPFELGARNPGAPPWEGRLIGFPSYNADTNAVTNNNTLIQTAINSMRPYGGTPTAALLADAEYYLWKDTTVANPPSQDPFVTGSGNCRKQYIILLTDGAPNEDLRPNCGTGSGSGGGKCPYDLPQNTTASLWHGTDSYTSNSGPQVITYVIGFAVSQIQSGVESGIAQCSQLNTGSPNSPSLSAICTTNPVPAQYQACCTLQNIALQGSNGATGAFFADTPGDLQAALGNVLGLIAKQVATRTTPTYASATSYATGTGTEALYLASFNAASTPWTGDIVRSQLTCSAGGVVSQSSPSAGAGDDFGQDVSVAASSGTRRFLSYNPPAGNTTVPTTSNLTIRPFSTASTGTAADGLGTLGSSATPGAELGNFGTTPASIVTTMISSPNAFQVTGTSCQDPDNRYFLTASDCANVALSYAMALPTMAPATSGSDGGHFSSVVWPRTTRCNGSGTGAVVLSPGCDPLGGVLHSTPTMSTPPSATLRDDSYQAYANDIAGFTTARPSVLYVATTDGLLHAFDTSVSSKTNNELWAFIPPAVLPGLLLEYYDASTILLDGAPIVRDMVWDRASSATTSCPGTADQCWHTMLVAGFGGGGRGYYALDVTDPRYQTFTALNAFPPPVVANSTEQTGPHFMWQLASTQPPPGGATGTYQELFGKQSGTPAMGHVLIQEGGVGGALHEIGVAILPGGLDGTPVPGGSCARVSGTASGRSGNYTNTVGIPYDESDPNFPSRTYVRQWASSCFGAGSSVAGRSVSVVRVDTGELLAVFARNPVDSLDVPGPANGTTTTLASGVLINTPFDSPMTGTPVPYPNELGADMQQVFIGDADGTLWHIDMTSTNPANWVASIFADPYGKTTEGTGVTGAATAPANGLLQVSDSQPVTVAPLIALDNFGNITVEFATGDLSNYTTVYSEPGSTAGSTVTPPVTNYIFATQQEVATPNQAKVNWYLKLTNGERVSGPMVVFNNTLYFATFAPPSTTTACSGGVPRIWGLDYTTPAPTCVSGYGNVCSSCGGACNSPAINAPSSLGNGGNPKDFLGQSPSGVYTSPPDSNGASTAGIVIPGLTVQYTPACFGTSDQIPAAPMLTAAVGRAPTGSGAPATPVGLGNLNGTTTAGGLPGTALSNLPRIHVDSWAGMVE